MELLKDILANLSRRCTYSRTSMARTRWDNDNMFETGVVRAIEGGRRHKKDLFDFLKHEGICCVFLLESSH